MPRDLFVQLRPSHHRDQVTTLDETHLQVSTVQPARDNKANLAAVTLLAKHLHLKRSQIVLIRGDKSRQKVFRIID